MAKSLALFIRIAPDPYDLLGGLICLAGVGVIMYAPR